MTEYEIKKTALTAEINALRKTITPPTGTFSVDCGVDSYFSNYILAELTGCKALRKCYEANPDTYLIIMCEEMMDWIIPKYLQMGVLNQLLNYTHDTAWTSVKTIINKFLAVYDEEHKNDDENSTS